jgi:hypothetical protein
MIEILSQMCKLPGSIEVGSRDDSDIIKLTVLE